MVGISFYLTNHCVSFASRYFVLCGRRSSKHSAWRWDILYQATARLTAEEPEARLRHYEKTQFGAVLKQWSFTSDISVKLWRKPAIVDRMACVLQLTRQTRFSTPSWSKWLAKPNFNTPRMHIWRGGKCQVVSLHSLMFPSHLRPFSWTEFPRGIFIHGVLISP
jgi:hypothetical protein